MKPRTKIFTGIIAIILSSMLLLYVGITYLNDRMSPELELGTRTIDLSNSAMDVQNIFNEFEDVSLTTKGAVTTFKGTKSLTFHI